LPAAARAVLVGLAALLLAAAARADSTVLVAAHDATLIEAADGAVANGAGPVFFAGRTGQSSDSRRRALVSFDVAASLPGGAQVTSAELVLVLTPSNATLADVTLHKVLAAWSEGPATHAGGSGAPAQPGDVTWLHTAYDSDFWAAPGGDFAPVPSGVAAVGAAGSFVWAATPQLVADVQGWLDAPASNHGWILVGDEAAPSTSKRFVSRENPAEAARPRLVIEYQPACEAADVRPGAFGPCHAYCEALDCDGPAPRGSERACDRLARRFAERTEDAPLPCELPDGDGDGVVDAADNCPDVANPEQLDSFGVPGVGDACECPCFAAADVDALLVSLDDAASYTAPVCFDTRPGKPLTGITATRLDQAPCATESDDCSVLAVTFTEDNACQLNPPAPAPQVEEQGISDAQREACRDAILDAAETAGLSCS